MKKITKTALLLVVLFLLVSVGCSTTSETSPKIEEVSVAQKYETPVVKEPEAVAEAKVKVEEPVVEVEIPVKKEFCFNYLYEFEGYQIEVEAHNGYGYVTYPDFITDEELAVALGEFVAAHGDFGVTYEKIGNGKLAVYYPEDLTKDDFDYVASIADSDLTWYLNQMFAPKAVEEPKAQAVVAIAEPVVEAPVAETPVVEEPKAETKVEVPVVTEQPKTEVKAEAKTTTTITTKVVETPVEQKKGISILWVVLLVIVVIIAAFFGLFTFLR